MVALYCASNESYMNRESNDVLPTANYLLTMPSSSEPPLLDALSTHHSVRLETLAWKKRG